MLKYTPPSIPLADEFENSEGKFAGLLCTCSDSRMLRYNWKLNDMSATIVSIDFWFNVGRGFKSPDLTLETEELNVVQLINVIVSTLNRDGEEYVVFKEKKLSEKFVAKRGGTKNPAIANALNTWTKDMNIDRRKLANTRISHLWREYQYWVKEVTDLKAPEMTDATFRNYILQLLDINSIENIYMRTIKVKKASKERQITTDKNSETAYKNIEHLEMNLDEMRQFMEDSVRGITRGYMNSLIICGLAGFGKTTAVRRILSEEGMQIHEPSTIKNIAHLYNIFLQNNTAKSVILFDDIKDVFSTKYSDFIGKALDDKPIRRLEFPLEAGKNAKKFNPELDFIGKIIILTNTPKNKIPNHFRSRTVPIEVTANTSDIVDNIRVELNNVMPEVPLKEKEMVLNFIQDLGKSINQIDFRSFQRCMVYYLTGSPIWKKQIKALLT